MTNKTTMNGFLREDGKKGIRNIILVVYLVECARHVAQEIVYAFRRNDIQMIGFGGCYPNVYADKMMNALCCHANVGAVLIVSLGCESFNRKKLEENIRHSGRLAHAIVIQQAGGTLKSVVKGKQWVSASLRQLQHSPRTNISVSDLIIGTICGGSDATSGITANPAVGKAFDKIVQQGGTAIFEETGEMIGLEKILSARAVNKTLETAIIEAIDKAAKYYTRLGHGSFAPGNAEGGLSTLEEKSLGAYCKSGSRPISGLLKPGDRPADRGLYLLDIVPDGEPVFGFPNINDNAEIAELIACGAHLVLFTTGRGSVVGSAVSPVIKICANPKTYKRMHEDMDINAGMLLTGNCTLEETATVIYDKILEVANGMPTCSETLGHQEFVLTYKSFESAGPGCLPLRG